MSWTNENWILPLLTAMALMALMATTNVSHAAPNKSPIQINADSVVLEEKTRSSLYSGSVELIQGNMNLSSDSLTVHTKNKRLSRLEAQGSPAMLNSISDEGRSMHGEADVIEYLASSRIIYLKGKAKLIQDGNTIVSERIEYDLAKGVLKAGSSKAGGRVNVILLPPEE